MFFYLWFLLPLAMLVLLFIDNPSKEKQETIDARCEHRRLLKYIVDNGLYCADREYAKGLGLNFITIRRAFKNNFEIREDFKVNFDREYFVFYNGEKVSESMWFKSYSVEIESDVPHHIIKESNEFLKTVKRSIEKSKDEKKKERERNKKDRLNARKEIFSK